MENNQDQTFDGQNGKRAFYQNFSLNFPSKKKLHSDTDSSLYRQTVITFSNSSNLYSQPNSSQTKIQQSSMQIDLELENTKSLNNTRLENSSKNQTKNSKISPVFQSNEQNSEYRNTLEVYDSQEDNLYAQENDFSGQYSSAINNQHNQQVNMRASNLLSNITFSIQNDQSASHSFINNSTLTQQLNSSENNHSLILLNQDNSLHQIQYKQEKGHSLEEKQIYEFDQQVKRLPEQFLNIFKSLDISEIKSSGLLIRFKAKDLNELAENIKLQIFFLDQYYERQADYLRYLFNRCEFKIASRLRILNQQQKDLVQSKSYNIGSQQSERNIMKPYHENKQKSQQTYYLVLNLSQLNNIDIQYFVQLQWDGLIELDFSDSQINNQNWKTLANSIKKFTRLKYLNLKKNHIKNVDQQELLHFDQLQSFKHLNLFDNQLTPQSSKLLESISKKNKINNSFQLQYSKTHDVTKDPFPLNNQIVVDKFAQRSFGKMYQHFEKNERIQKLAKKLQNSNVQDPKDLQEQIKTLALNVLRSELERIILKHLKQSGLSYIQKNVKILEELSALGKDYLDKINFRFLYEGRRASYIFEQRKIAERIGTLQGIIDKLGVIFNHDHFTNNYKLIKKNIINYRNLARLGGIINLKWTINTLMEKFQPYVFSYIKSETEQFAKLMEVIKPILLQLLEDLLDVFKNQNADVIQMAINKFFKSFKK